MNWFKQIFTAVALLVIFTVITGVVYPLIVTGAALLFFKEKAQGSLIVKDGKTIGSRLIGQSFKGPGYFHSRPSAAGIGYDAASSGGTNLGPTSKTLIEERIRPEVESLRVQEPNRAIPADLVTSSASGLDPHITPAAAEHQVARVAAQRNMSEDEVRKLVRMHTEGRQFGFLGEPRVNVLELNLALDAAQH